METEAILRKPLLHEPRATQLLRSTANNNLFVPLYLSLYDDTTSLVCAMIIIFTFQYFLNYHIVVLESFVSLMLPNL